jgi:uncharacterized protein YbbC (DUF1343 family)
MTNQTGMAGMNIWWICWSEHQFNVVGIFLSRTWFFVACGCGRTCFEFAVDEKTNIPIWSLYGSGSGKPSPDEDEAFRCTTIRPADVGLRFKYLLRQYGPPDGCLRGSRKKMIVLDRPNPNGFYVDGPILDMKHKSGCRVVAYSVVHGMTLGELALMINGEKWLPEAGCVM